MSFCRANELEFQIECLRKEIDSQRNFWDSDIARLELAIKTELRVVNRDLANERDVSSLNERLDKLEEQSRDIALQLKTFERSVGYLVIVGILWAISSWFFN